MAVELMGAGNFHAFVCGLTRMRFISRVVYQALITSIALIREEKEEEEQESRPVLLLKVNELGGTDFLQRKRM